MSPKNEDLFCGVGKKYYKHSLDNVLRGREVCKLDKFEIDENSGERSNKKGLEFKKNCGVNLLNSNKKEDNMNRLETDEQIKNYLKDEIDWNRDSDFWTIEIKINQYQTENIVLNPWADVSEINPLYRHRDWMKTVVEDKELNLTDSKFAKICRITEHRLINWRNTIHGIKKGIGATKSEEKINRTTSDQRSVEKPKHDYNQLNSENANSEHSKQFLSDLMALIEKHPKALARKWPDRVDKYSHIQLSKLFGREKHFINRTVVKANKNPEYRVPTARFEDLKINLEKKLGAKALGCNRIIISYDKQEINTTEFIKKMEDELGRVSGDVPLSSKKFSEIISNSPTSMVAMMSNRFNPKSATYQPNYLFSKERLEAFKENIENNLSIFDKDIDGLFSKYIENNPDIKDYAGEKYENTKPHFFSEINTSEKSYWFGFMCSDGWLTSTHRNKYEQIGFSQKVEDKERVEAFARAVGLPSQRVIDRERKDHSILGHKVEENPIASEVRFQCKPMSDDLRRLGFLDFKQKLENIPPPIKEIINQAKLKGHSENQLWLNTEEGKIACGFLLGIYDGDGTYKGGRSAIVYSSSKELLQDIKQNYDIPNKVRVHSYKESEGIKEPNMYVMGLGPKVFDGIMKSNKDSM